MVNRGKTCRQASITIADKVIADIKVTLLLSFNIFIQIKV